MDSVTPLRESDLIFSTASSTLKDALGELKRSDLSIINRLKSIKQDAEFVEEVANAYQLPLLANERCGSWYIHPDLKAGSVYFKSTDGHFGHWQFSLRRLNLQIFEVIEQHGGCIIVDSTRRGKSMPDALSKTVPIWITVLNRLLYPNDSDSHSLNTPSDVVSESEHAQISQMLKSFTIDVKALNLETTALRQKLSEKPIRVIWIRPGDPIPNPPSRSNTANLIVLCTASGRTNNQLRASSYVQGAADDHETWAQGLDPTTFWIHSEQILLTAEEDLPSLIESLVERTRHLQTQPFMTRISPPGNVWIGNDLATENAEGNFDVVISCAKSPNLRLTESVSAYYINLSCTTGKIGSRQLRSQLPKLLDLPSITTKSKILISCPTGKDIAIGAALALLCLRFDRDGNLHDINSTVFSPLTKTVIKHKLSWIMVSMPDAAPSRATLQSVNAFLMG